MGPTWGRQDPGGPHVGPMNLAIRDMLEGVKLLRMMSNLWGTSPVNISYSAFYIVQEGSVQNMKKKDLH